MAWASKSGDLNGNAADVVMLLSGDFISAGGQAATVCNICTGVPSDKGLSVEGEHYLYLPRKLSDIC